MGGGTGTGIENIDNKSNSIEKIVRKAIVELISASDKLEPRAKDRIKIYHIPLEPLRFGFLSKMAPKEMVIVGLDDKYKIFLGNKEIDRKKIGFLREDTLFDLHYMISIGSYFQKWWMIDSEYKDIIKKVMGYDY